MAPKAFAYIGASAIRSAQGQLDCIEGGRQVGSHHLILAGQPSSGPSPSGWSEV